MIDPGWEYSYPVATSGLFMGCFCTCACHMHPGGQAGFGSRGKDRWWAFPACIIGGSMIGCAMDGG